MSNSPKYLALVGNPNTGKSTIFNLLTGLDQKVSNFPGVTVEKKTGQFVGLDGRVWNVIDLPGSYSLYPKSKDEGVVVNALLANEDKKPDLIVFIADATNLKRNLLLFSQVADLGLPMILVINMADELEKVGLRIETNILAKLLGVQVVLCSAKKDKRLLELKKALSYCTYIPTQEHIYHLSEQELSLTNTLDIDELNPYGKLQLIHQYRDTPALSQNQKENIKKSIEQLEYNTVRAQTIESIIRYRRIYEILDKAIFKDDIQKENSNNLNWFDKIATHRVWGFALFFAILYLMFQAIFSWSEFPMDLIDKGFSLLIVFSKTHLPDNIASRLFTDGILSGLSGVLVFIPQIAFLFIFISILEDTGYMSRVMFITDRLMQKIGLNGKSIVPLIGGFACAVPSILSTRNIGNKKERLITILVTPLVSCSARLPIYILLISMIVPNNPQSMFFNTQGLVLLGLFLFSIISSFIVAFILKHILKTNEKSYLVMELPVYRQPDWASIAKIVLQKVKTFVFEAGKIIIIISLVLWWLCSFAPSGKFEEIDKKYSQKPRKESYEKEIQAEKLSVSYAGIVGKSIEPIIKPLGFDWKIGIALITSFAAREVFVGTMATLYSAESSDDDLTSVRAKLEQAVNSNNQPTFTTATVCSLLMFYIFALQCMSTLAVVHKETGNIKWPILQFLYMGSLAYVFSFITYAILK